MSDGSGFDERGHWRCSLAARARGDQRVGTAVPARRWFLVEHPGPWARTAVGTAPIESVRAPLQAALAQAGARLQLVRRHPRVGHQEAVDGVERSVLLVDCLTGTIRSTTWRTAADLVRLAEDFDAELPPAEGPVLLVCTHGKKDQCCAIEGRAVAAALEAELPGTVWETTHLGGDRFAGGLVHLPDGSMYGGLDASTAVPVMRQHLAGGVDLEHWRGRSVWPAPGQAAVADVLAGTPLRLAEVEAVEVTAAGRDAWSVVVVGGGRRESRTVTRSLAPPRRLTCQPEAERSAVFTVTA